MAKYFSKKITAKTVAGTAIFCSIFYSSLFYAVGATPTKAFSDGQESSLEGQVALAEDATGTLPTATPSEADCKLDDALKALLAVKDSDLSTQDRNQAELKARKDVLTQIVICSEVELNAFKKRLNDFDLKDNDKKDSQLRDKFLSDINTADSYFNDINNRLAGNIDLAGVKTLARDLAAWREKFYVPTLSNMNEFLLVVQNQQAIRTARARFDKIFFSLGAVKLNNTTDIKKLLGESDRYIKKGAELNEQAHALAWTANFIFDNASSSPTSTAVTATSGSEATSTTINASSTEASATSTPVLQPILPLVRDSLGELKKAYGDYIAISNIVKKYLGL